MTKQTIDVNFINPFIDSAVETFKVQCSFPVTAEKPCLKENAPKITIDIAAVIGLASPVFKGSIAICFPQIVFLTLMEGMLGEKFKIITRELEDGASELLNIIFGQAKRVLNTKNYNIEKAIPTIVRGAGIQVRHLTIQPVIVLPFSTSVGQFYIEITID